MAQKVTVFNKNTHPIKEIFKGEEVFIGPQDYWRTKDGKVKEMDIFEANDYRGQYAMVPFDGSGKMINDPRYFKMIELRPVVQEADDHEDFEDSSTNFKCMATNCKFVGTNTEEFNRHCTIAHPETTRLILPDEDREIEKKRRGRPPKAERATA